MMRWWWYVISFLSVLIHKNLTKSISQRYKPIWRNTFLISDTTPNLNILNLRIVGINPIRLGPSSKQLFNDGLPFFTWRCIKHKSNFCGTTFFYNRSMWQIVSWSFIVIFFRYFLNKPSRFKFLVVDSNISFAFE